MDKKFSVKLEAELHREASIVAAATDRTLSDLYACGLRREIAAVAIRDPKIAAMLRELRSE